MSREKIQFPETLRNAFANAPMRVGIVVSRFNESITKRLAVGAVTACKTAGFSEEKIDLHYVAGAFELPQAASLLIKSRGYHAVVCLGAIIQGETEHHQHLATAIFPELERLACDSGVPIGVGVLTCATVAQAEARLDKGLEATCAALELLEMKRRLPS